MNYIYNIQVLFTGQIASSLLSAILNEYLGEAEQIGSETQNIKFERFGGQYKEYTVCLADTARDSPDICNTEIVIRKLYHLSASCTVCSSTVVLIFQKASFPQLRCILSLSFANLA